MFVFLFKLLFKKKDLSNFKFWTIICISLTEMVYLWICVFVFLYFLVFVSTVYPMILDLTLTRFYMYDLLVETWFCISKEFHLFPKAQWDYYFFFIVIRVITMSRQQVDPIFNLKKNKQKSINLRKYIFYHWTHFLPKLY